MSDTPHVPPQDAPQAGRASKRFFLAYAGLVVVLGLGFAVYMTVSWFAGQPERNLKLRVNAMKQFWLLHEEYQDTFRRPPGSLEEMRKLDSMKELPGHLVASIDRGELAVKWGTRTLGGWPPVQGPDEVLAVLADPATGDTVVVLMRDGKTRPMSKTEYGGLTIPKPPLPTGP